MGTRSGTGVIKRFKGDPSGVVVGIQRFGREGVSLLVCDQDVALGLTKKFGVFDAEKDWTQMSGIIGLPCLWTEEHGRWSNIEALPN